MAVSSIHPGFIMIIMSLLVMILPDKVRKYAFVAAPALAFASVFTLNKNSVMTYTINENAILNFIRYDRLAAIFLLAFCIIALIGTIYGANAKTKQEMAAELMYAGCNMGVVLAGDCLSLIAFWELSALASAYVVYSGHNKRAERAAFRYLLMHAFGGGMLLAGLLMYISKYGNEITNLNTISGSPIFWIVLIGVAVNAAIPPLNSWLPDAYPESTIGGTVFLGSFTTKAAIYVLIRMFAGTTGLLWAGAFMAVYGVLMALLENDIRRLLSYHIISQLGYMIASLAVGGVWGIDGAAAHAFNHIMYKGLLLMCAGAIIYSTGKRKISELGGLGKKMPLVSICFLIASFSISGMPLFNGFVSKALIMHAVEESGHPLAFWLLSAASVGTWLSITLKINYYVFWKPSDKDIEVQPIPLNMKIAMIVGSAICTTTGVFPKLAYNITPYATDGHPFTLMHVLEYLILFSGATAVFFLFGKMMEPHDEISLDFDWVYRKGLNRLVLFLSRILHDAFDFCAVKVISGVRKLAAVFSDPYSVTRLSKNEWINKLSIENEDQTIGDITIRAIVVLLLMVVIGIIVI